MIGRPLTTYLDDAHRLVGFGEFGLVVDLEVGFALLGGLLSSLLGVLLLLGIEHLGVEQKIVRGGRKEASIKEALSLRISI